MCRVARWQILFCVGTQPNRSGREPFGRRRRGDARLAHRFLGLDEPPADSPLLVDELHRWALGLPFVEELHRVPTAPHIRRFAVHCPPLNCSAVWLLTGGYQTEVPDPDDNIYAVLPRSLAQAVAGAGGTLGPNLPDERRFVALGALTRPDELLELEDVLLIAYLSVFEAAET